MVDILSYSPARCEVYIAPCKQNRKLWLTFSFIFISLNSIYETGIMYKSSVYKAFDKKQETIHIVIFRRRFQRFANNWIELWCSLNTKKRFMTWVFMKSAMFTYCGLTLFSSEHAIYSLIWTILTVHLFMLIKIDIVYLFFQCLLQ